VRVRSAIADSDTFLARHKINDLDYLTARLHGRRSRMAEGERLAGLCRIRHLSEFINAIFPGMEQQNIAYFQQRLVNELAKELYGFLTSMSGPGAALLYWALVRFYVENLKILLRLHLTGSRLIQSDVTQPDLHPAESRADNLPQYIIPLSGELALDGKTLASAKTLEEFVQLVPLRLFRDSLEKAFEIYPENLRPYFLEAALDNGYFQVLLTRLQGLQRFSRKDMEIITPMIFQEVDIFHLMHIIRGRFHYGLKPEVLQPLHIAGTRISRGMFDDILDTPDPSELAGILQGRVVDEVPFTHELSCDSASSAVDETSLERYAWKRYLRLANLAFRQSHIGLAAVIGYVGIRRIEVANLITISEGIRKGLGPEKIHSRLIIISDKEAAHV
jgi:vacuolar-type H+-ATPase subunit C/Vma6